MAGKDRDENGRFMPGNVTATLGGRPKGVKNLKHPTEIVQAIVADTGVNPFVVMAEVASGKTMCSLCIGKGDIPMLLMWRKVGYTPTSKEMKSAYYDTPCFQCSGTGTMAVDPRDRVNAAKGIARHIAPTLKSVEVQITNEEVTPEFVAIPVVMTPQEALATSPIFESDGRAIEIVDGELVSAGEAPPKVPPKKTKPPRRKQGKKTARKFTIRKKKTTK